MRTLRIVMVVCSIALPAATQAQETIHYASVGGRVIDPQGGPVAGADVTARHLQTNVTATTAAGHGRPLPASRS